MIQSSKQVAREVLENSNLFIPPHDEQLEISILGTIMLYKQALDKVIDFITPEHFYFEKNAIIYKSIFNLRAEFAPIDIKTVHNKITQTNAKYGIDQIDLVKMTQTVYSSESIDYHCKYLHELFLRRRISERLQKYISNSYNLNSDIFELIDSLENEIFDFKTKEHKLTTSQTAKELGPKVLHQIAIRGQSNDTLTGVPTGFKTINTLTSGWQPSELIIIAARPGMGKTSFLISTMRMLGVVYKIPVAIFSLEMSSASLMTRLYSNDTDINSSSLKTGKLTAQQWQVLSNSPVASPLIHIDDTTGLTLFSLVSKIRRYVLLGVQIIFIDYLQLITLNQNTNSNREQEIAKISRTLKTLSKEFNIPIIALSQLSRAVETRADKRPQLSDLRESGSIEQDADVVGFLYRPEYYKIFTDEYGQSTQGLAEFIIAKNRNGSIGVAKLKFQGHLTKFLDEQDMTQTHESWKQEF